MNIDYTLWPNTDGNLGNIKVQIPTGIGDDKWPEGDALINNVVYKDGLISGFVDNKALTVNESKTTTINYDYCDIELPFAEAEMIINRGPRSKYFNVRYSIADGEEIALIHFEDMDEDTKALLRSATKIINNTLYDAENNVIGTFDTKRIATGSNLEVTEDWDEYSTDGKPLDSLFSTYNLETWDKFREMPLVEFNSNLSSLTRGCYMFEEADNLTTFNSNLSSLTVGYYMFDCCGNLTSFNNNLSSLTDGRGMFYNCYNLTTVASDLSSLIIGEQMFYQCENLTRFNSDLSSLENGFEMFDYCKLNSASVKNIIDTIKTVSDAELSLGIGCDNTAEDKNLFAQEIGYKNMAALLYAFQLKGWTVNAVYNGRPTTTTYSLRRPSEDTLPVFVKLEEVEKRANYTSADESKKYKLSWFHETTGSTEGYTQYATLEDAVANMRLTKIEKPQMLTVNR